MRKITLLIFFFLTVNYCYSQEVEETYDKFEKTGSLTLKEYINLDVGDGLANTFEVNLAKITTDGDSAYYFLVDVNSLIDGYADEDMEAIFLLDDEVLKLKSAYGSTDISDRYWLYFLGYRLTPEQVIQMYKAKKIDIRCYINGASFDASFSTENKNTLDKYIRNHLLKELVY